MRKKFFKTIKARMLLLMFAMFFVLCSVAGLFSYNSYENNKRLKIEACNLNVAYFAEDVNKSISSLEINAIDLALTGQIYYDLHNYNKKILNDTVRQNFVDNPASIGGGIWFEPYSIDKNLKFYCTYAFKKEGNTIIDPSFETEKYNYLKQNWYLSIKANIQDGGKVFWTVPYFDETGTKALMTTVGAGIFDNEKKFVGMSTVDCILDSIVEKLSSLRPTENSIVMFADTANDFIMALVDGSKNKVGSSLKTVPWYNDNLQNCSEIDYNGITYITFKRILNNEMVFIVNVPKNELLKRIIMRLKILTSMLIVICSSIAFGTYFILRKYINKPINYLVALTTEIGSGNLDSRIELYDPEEFANLADSFNKMTSDIKSYIKNISIISAEKKRIESELEIGKAIQLSALPKIFPPYPDRKEFDIYATMNAAREVGGDFYDFFFIDDDRLVFLIADVSGKGVPAALFMMTSKTLIKSLASTHLSAVEILTRANNQISKENEQDFFVTVFMCVIELSTGNVTCVNAGHNPPIIKYSNGSCEYFSPPPDIVVGAFENSKYNSHEIQLKKNDSILLYTDGVTEALNKRQELYGEDRLLEFVKRKNFSNEQEVLDDLKCDVEKFVNGEQQSDDITLLLFKYKGKC